MRLDKTAFKKQSLQEANSHQEHYQQLSVSEYAKVFITLMQAAYGFVNKPFPKMEKVYIGARKTMP